MTEIISTIKSLTNLLPLKAATDVDITDAELQLRVSFSEDYKEYLCTFGAILADGIELTGIANSEHRNVVLVTKQERGLNAEVPHSMYVIENTYIDGIIIWQDSEGIVYQSSPNSKPEQIAKSLSEYVSARIK